jgi:hypothetical protein
VDRGEEISGCLVIACRNGSVLLELAEEVLHQVTRLVHLLVKGALDLSIAFGWDHELFSCRKQRFDHALVGIEGFIRQQGIGLHLRQQRIGSFQVMGLAGSQEKRSGIAQCVDHGVDFGAQSALAAPDRLVFAVFFWAPALCWCARTMVLSIMAYSLSASAARISNTFFHTPLPAQRENRV